MSDSYQFQFPKLFKQWRRHDLAFHDGEAIRSGFYEGLRREDRNRHPLA